MTKKVKSVVEEASLVVRDPRAKGTRNMLYNNGLWVFLTNSGYLPFIASAFYLPGDFFSNPEIAGHTSICIGYFLRELQELYQSAVGRVVKWIKERRNG